MTVHVMRIGHVFKEPQAFHLRGFFLRQKDMPLHTQEFFEIVFILDGSALHLTPGRMEGISRGDVLIIPAGGSHGYSQTEKLLIFNLLFVLEDLSLPQLDLLSHPGFRALFLRQHEYFEHHGEYPRFRFREEKLRYVETLLKKLSETGSRTAGKCARLGYLLVLISIICDHWESFRHSAPEYSQGVLRAAAYIDRKFRRPIHLEELARIADMSRNTLLRNFRRSTGCTPMEYLLRRRLACACGMLMQTTLRINEIAAECGFADTAYFTRVFRKKMGCTAGEYRRGEHRTDAAAPGKNTDEVPPRPQPPR